MTDTLFKTTVELKMDAIRNLRPEASFTFSGIDVEWEGDNITNITWHDDTVCPTKSEFDTEYASVQSDYDSKDYQRKRFRQYPSLKEFADAYYHAQKGDNTLMDAYISKCDAVKNDYPKPE